MPYLCSGSLQAGRLSRLCSWVPHSERSLRRVGLLEFRFCLPIRSQIPPSTSIASFASGTSLLAEASFSLPALSMEGCAFVLSCTRKPKPTVVYVGPVSRRAAPALAGEERFFREMRFARSACFCFARAPSLALFSKGGSFVFFLPFDQFSHEFFAVIPRSRATRNLLSSPAQFAPRIAHDATPLPSRSSHVPWCVAPDGQFNLPASVL